MASRIWKKWSMKTYKTPSWVCAFTTGQEPFPFDESELAMPRQVHSAHVEWACGPGRAPETDAVVTDVPGLPLVIKTADCIPVLLWDDEQRRVAAVHAGWRGTVADITGATLDLMQSRGGHIGAVIGPGISQPVFEVGDEVFDAFSSAGFPMDRIALRQGKWHLDLFEANRWLLERRGVTNIQVDGTCTFRSPYFYSARRDTINTGRNLNCILIKEG